MARMLLSLAACAILLTPAVVHAAEPAQQNPALLDVDKQQMPVRVHVFEDYETQIERRWWLRGEEETKNTPPSLSPTVKNTRAFRAGETHDFDRKMGDAAKTYKAVIFNPVPGPPMAGRTRLRFRYWLSGTDAIRVQIYSLTNNYHRRLTLEGLPQRKWTEAVVDMTKLRRPDGSGGPLAKDERIDDIQFYISPDAELLIDDIVLYDAAAEGEKASFPSRVIFTGWFDTGKQGAEWPGKFEIVLHEKPRGWDFARSIADEKTKAPTLRVNMRGRRAVGGKVKLRLLARLDGEGPVQVALVDSKSGRQWTSEFTPENRGEWSQAEVAFAAPEGTEADNIVFTPPAGSVLDVDDLLLFEP